MTAFSTKAMTSLALFVLLLTGCAPQSSYTPEQRRAAAAELLADRTPEPAPYVPPVCYSGPQCDAMWSEALVQLQNLSGMRIQTATDVFAQTYNATGVSRQTGIARKIPRPDGSTVIDAEFSCGYCSNLVYQARDLFASSVRAAGSGFRIPNQPQAPDAQPTPSHSADDYRKAFSDPGAAK